MQQHAGQEVRIGFFGNGAYSLTVLKILHARERTPCAVVTEAGSVIDRWARERDIAVVSPTQLDEAHFVKDLRELEADVFVVAGFTKLPHCVYTIPKYQTLNIHPSLLPAYRGHAPEVAQILNDERDLGVTIHVIDEVFDHGPIVAQATYRPALWPMAAPTLSHELAQRGAHTLLEVLDNWIAGDITVKPQREVAATYCTEICANTQTKLESHMPSADLWRLFCAHGWEHKIYFELPTDNAVQRVYPRTAYQRNGFFVVNSVFVNDTIMSYDEFLEKFQLTHDKAWKGFSVTHNTDIESNLVDSKSTDPIIRLREAIFTNVLVFGSDTTIVDPDGTTKKDNWLFDFRNIFLEPAHLDTIAEIFWEHYSDRYPFQVGGQETAAIPLITAIILRGKQLGKSVNGFFIRKERKPTGLQKRIEGTLTNEKIILVDDLMNSGSTQLRQVEVLEAHDKHVSDIFILMRFRETRHYRFASEKQIAVQTLFTPSTFGLTSNKTNQELPQQSKFLVNWKFVAENPNHFYIVPKSQPTLHKGRIFFGSDNGTFWALDQATGKTLWTFKIWRHSRQKSIFSSPVVWCNTVYFGAYDGNLYALDCASGKKRWVYTEADWIGSSPCLAPDQGRVFVGLEFGLFKKKGGIVALDATTGEKSWTFAMPGLTHGSPAYSGKYAVVGVGCNDNYFYLLDAKSGALKWKLETGGPIKYRPAFDEKLGRVLFGSHDGKLYACDITTGTIIETFMTEGEIYSTPYIHTDQILLTSFDKRLYSLERERLTEQWRFETSGKILCSPTVINEHVYTGSNDGFLYEFATDGTPTDFFHAGERIVNNVVYNDSDNTFFLWTHANELFKLRKADVPQ